MYLFVDYLLRIKKQSIIILIFLCFVLNNILAYKMKINGHFMPKRQGMNNFVRSEFKRELVLF